MKKGRFLWSAHRITERQKAGKARNIKGKQLKNSRSTASKPQEERRSFQRDKDYCEYGNMGRAPGMLAFPGLFPYFRIHKKTRDDRDGAKRNRGYLLDSQ